MTPQPQPFDKAQRLANYRAEQKRRATLSPWMQKYLHEFDIKRMREQTDEIIRGYADLRRKEEAMTADHREFMWKHSEWKAQRGIEPLPRDLAVRRLDYIVERDGMVLDEAQVARYRADAEKWARHYKTTVLEVATPGTNAYAFTKLNKIEVAPIVNACSYAVRMHEQGHAAHPCPDSHTRATTEDGKRTACVQCELVAWEWAIDHAIEWTHDMHRRLSDSLNTYAKYTVGDQIETVRRMCAPMGYSEARFRRAMRSH